jgi:hypothetical protein
MQRGETARTTMSDLPDGAYERAFGHTEPRINGLEVIRTSTKPVRKHDSVNIKGSLSLAVPVYQAEEFTRKHGHLGVKWVPEGDVAVPLYKDRSARIKVMNAFGSHDPDEVRGGH